MVTARQNQSIEYLMISDFEDFSLWFNSVTKHKGALNIVNKGQNNKQKSQNDIYFHLKNDNIFLTILNVMNTKYNVHV